MRILVFTHFGGEGGCGWMSISRLRPTLKSNETRCEVYLLSAPETELYGERMEVHLHQKLRDDRVFPSLEALRRQLDHDVAQARSLLLSYEEDLEPILA